MIAHGARSPTLVGERGEIAAEGEPAGLVERRQTIEKQAAEQAREHAHGQEEAGLAGDPARPVRRQAAARNDNVDMRMMGERRAPGVEDGSKADARAQMLGISRDRRQRLGGDPEQQVVDDGLVLEPDRADRRRQGEDDVIIGNRQQLGFTFGEPLPGGRGAPTALSVPRWSLSRPLVVGSRSKLVRRRIAGPQQLPIARVDDPSRGLDA